jgi:hypothetical protein
MDTVFLFTPTRLYSEAYVLGLARISCIIININLSYIAYQINIDHCKILESGSSLSLLASLSRANLHIL